jgi:hypothetical protein
MTVNICNSIFGEVEAKVEEKKSEARLKVPGVFRFL